MSIFSVLNRLFDGLSVCSLITRSVEQGMDSFLNSIAYTKYKYGRRTIFCLDRFSRKEKQLNNYKDQVKISHYVHFRGHILILGEVIGNQN